MSTLTREQLLKFAAAWQAVLSMIFWYVNAIGIETLNSLLFGIALVAAFVIVYLRKDNTEKVVTAVGTIDRFYKSQQESRESKVEVTDEEDERIEKTIRRYVAFFKNLRDTVEEIKEEALEKEPEEVDAIG